MKVEIIRQKSDDKQTLGKMYINDALVAHTLELAWKNNQRRISCIPEGTYKVVKRTSPKYREHFHILDVPNRDWILIHHGNYHRDILGCILVGRTHADIDGDGYLDVTHSVATMKMLNELLPDSFDLLICGLENC
jgi:hypothetical protein